MTRKELIKALRCFASEDYCPFDECNEKCPYWMEIDKYDIDNPNAEISDVHQLCCAAADLLEQDAQGWISVKDRIPEYGEQVLLTAYGWSDTTVYIGQLKHMDAETSWLTGITNKESEWCIRGWSYLKEPVVTHWMSLPEPPKEDDDDRNCVCCKYQDGTGGVNIPDTALANADEICALRDQVHNLTLYLTEALALCPEDLKVLEEWHHGLPGYAPEPEAAYAACRVEEKNEIPME